MTDKVDKYLLKFTDKVEVSQSGKSRYYNLNNKVIRVSDHVGNNSDGCYHIIVKPNGYLIHHPQTGTINIVDYEQVKEFIRVFMMFPFANTSYQVFYPRESMEGDKILGVDVKYFTKDQLKTIMDTTNKVKKTHKL